MRQLLLGMGLAGQQLNLHVLYQFVYWNNTTTTQLIHSCKTAQKRWGSRALCLPANFAWEATQCWSSEFTPSYHTINLVWGVDFTNDDRRRMALWFIMASTHAVSLLKLLSQHFCTCRLSCRWSPYGFFSKSSQ
jgi:hypothetical protein